MKLKPSPEAFELAKNLLANCHSVTNCEWCNGHRVIPEPSGCGDAAGGWADTCELCNGKGYTVVGKDRRIENLQRRTTAEDEALKKAAPWAFVEAT